MVDRSVPGSGETHDRVTADAPAAVSLRVALPNDPDAAALEIGPRPDGRGYSDRDVGAVVEVVGLASRAIGLIERAPERAAAVSPDSP